MIGRVTQRSIALNSLTNLQNAQSRTAKLQEQLSSGKSLSKGSDDSVRAAAALRLNDQIAGNDANTRNIADARAWNTTQEEALTSVADRLSYVRDLAVRAGNATLDDKGRAAIVAEINEAKASILGSANAQYQGRAVFAGTRDTTQAYDPVTYASADNGAAVTRTISPGVDMTVNVNGGAVFGTAPNSLFDELTDLAAAVTANNGTAIGASLVGLDSRISKNATALATIGARDNQLDHAEEVNANQLQYLRTQLDDVEGVDMAKTYVEFNMQNVAYQAALQATAKTIQPTLLDFLR
ncbi:flagellar hook-associated protein FlgL [Kineococcus aurantiacus]|uniref:Flagellar hook-associated protein 3 FlgL n=1 Tax=Kineococcus aurantiacus TaxID=37633 RepID=A0A7Y9DPY0_9ACTN|nr:flagellar hook-associated protein FlgL [Kineococcus aurantiacus]NYD24572.1 flagellar hook-associated protein 3 FlgL [Kineococcus aurantiacus]